MTRCWRVLWLCVVWAVLPAPASAQALDDRALASFRRGVAAQERGAWEAARQAYQQAIEAAPELAAAHANLGVVLARLDQYAAAVASYERALAIAPDLQAARINLGLAHFRAGEIERAVDTFEQALARDSTSLHVRQLLGLALVDAGREAEAIPHLEVARAAAEEDPAILFALGRAYAARGDPRVDEVATQLSTSPGGRPLWQHLRGLLLQRQGRHREAITALEAARTAQPELPGASLAVGISQLAVGDEALAREAFERAQRDAPRDGAPLFYLAWIEERAGRLVQARQRLEEALLLDAGLVEARALLGKVLLRQQAPSEAVRHLDKAAGAKPEDASIRYLLAQAHQRAGDGEAAARHFDEARRLKAREVARERAVTR